MSSKKRFIKYNGSRTAFNNKQDRTEYDESIVFITGDPKLSNVDACLYTQGSYFPNTNDFVNGLLTVQGNAANYTDTQIANASSNYETKGAANTAIQGLNADVSSTNGSKVTVQVVETAGKITNVNVTESDIASAATLKKVQDDVDKFFKDASFAENAKDTLKELQEYINSDASLAATLQNNITAAQNTATGAQNAVDALAVTVGNISLSSLGGIAGSEVDTKIGTAISGLDHTNSGSGNYVTAVSQTDGKVTVTYGTLPTYKLVTGTANGTVKFNNTDVSVKGLGSAAYVDTAIFATAEQGTLAVNAAPKTSVYTKTEVDTMLAAWEWEEISD